MKFKIKEISENSKEELEDRTEEKEYRARDEGRSGGDVLSSALDDDATHRSREVCERQVAKHGVVASDNLRHLREGSLLSHSPSDVRWRLTAARLAQKGHTAAHEHACLRLPPYSQ